MSNNVEKTIADAIDDQNRLRVHLVPMMSGDNPWRTQGDYAKEQEAFREMHQKQLEGHELLIKSNRRNSIALWITTLIMVGTLVSATVALISYLDKFEKKLESSTATVKLDAGNSPKPHNKSLKNGTREKLRAP